jgi:hypothetical protein
MIAALWGRIYGWLAALGAVLAVLGTAYLKGRREGIAKMEREQAAAREQSAKVRKDIDDDVGKIGRDELDRRNSRWMRDGD